MDTPAVICVGMDGMDVSYWAGRLVDYNFLLLKRG